MRHCGTKQLETERLLLRNFVLEDVEAVYRNWASDDEVTKFLMWNSHKDLDITRFVVDDWVNSYKNSDFYQWAIVLKDEGNEPIGSIGVVKEDENISMVHIGYCIGKKYWNKGITSEALKSVIEYFFNEVGVNRIESRHDVNNPNSGKVMKKCGMKYEGTLRQSDINNQGICDTCYYAILKSDYKEK